LRILSLAGRSRADVSLLFSGDRRMRRLDRTYRGKDSSTDVLAFPAGKFGRKAAGFLGDVVISLPRARRQARAAAVTVDREVTTLLIHGVLHLMGYDHETNARDARRMRRKEQALLRSLGRLPTLVKG
jgi:probable rRNA maturation factor